MRISLPLLAGVLLFAAGCNRQAAGNDSAGPASNAAGTPAAGGAAERFAAFDAVCGSRGGIDALAALAAQNGWTPFTPGAESDLGRVIALGARMVTSAGGRTESRAFSKTVAGRELNLVVSDTMAGGQGGIECRIYDFAASGLPTDGEIAAWAPAAPTTRGEEQGVIAVDWRPGFRPGFTRIGIAFIRPDSPIRAQIPLSGLTLLAEQGVSANGAPGENMAEAAAN